MSGEYEVEGYGRVQPEYDQPYLRGAGFKPEVVFAKGGDPEAQEQHQKDLASDIQDDDFSVKPYAEPLDPTYPQTLSQSGAIPYDLHASNADKIRNLEAEIARLKDAEDTRQKDTEPSQPNGEPLYGVDSKGDAADSPEDAESVEGTFTEGDDNRQPDPYEEGSINTEPTGDEHDKLADEREQDKVEEPGSEGTKTFVGPADEADTSNETA